MTSALTWTVRDVDCLCSRPSARSERGHGLFAHTDSPRLCPNRGLIEFADLPRSWPAAINIERTLRVRAALKSWTQKPNEC